MDVRRRRSHDQRTRRDRLGIKERIALAVVLDALQHLPIDEQDRVILELVDLLRSVAKGEIVDRLAAEAKAAMIALDDDDRLECLTKPSMLARATTGLRPPGSSPLRGNARQAAAAAGSKEFRRPLLSSEYRGMATSRRAGGPLRLPHPSSWSHANARAGTQPQRLFRTGQIGRDPNSWAVSYDPLPPTTGATT